MIRVSLFEDAQGLIYGYHITGHAGFAEAGSDIICSAVSVLGINTANSIETLTGETPEVRMKDGDLLVQVPSLYPGNEGAPNEQARLLLNSFKLGIRSICEQVDSSYIVMSTNQN